MPVSKREALRTLNFGNQIAEEEREFLKAYFVETQAWQRIYGGDVDIVYGPKGAGKSAIYVLVNDSLDQLFDRKILIVTGENPRGTPAFKDLVADPPTSEKEFVSIWKLFFASLIARALMDIGLSNKDSESLNEILADNNLLPSKTSTLGSILKSVRNYVVRIIKPQSVEGSVTVSPDSGLQTYSGKISFEEPDIGEKAKGFLSVDELMAIASSALKSGGYKVWVMVDRLDVAFDDSSELEKNALRALFKAYRDIRSLDNIEIKIFLRTDIWKRITEEGFREATHLSRDINLDWDKPSLQNLIVRRLLNNQNIVELYAIDKAETLSSSSKQTALFDRIFPDQVEVGEKQSTTIDWLLKRTSDATNTAQPRDIILFLNSLCEVQNQRLERGEPEPEGEFLFDRAAFKEALPALSEYRVNRVLYAEYPHLRKFIDALKEQKTEQNAESLADLWKLELSEARAVARQLRDVGFFEERTSKGEITYWVPFVYRPYLVMSQGKVEGILRTDG